MSLRYSTNPGTMRLNDCIINAVSQTRWNNVTVK